MKTQNLAGALCACIALSLPLASQATVTNITYAVTSIGVYDSQNGEDWDNQIAVDDWYSQFDNSWSTGAPGNYSLTLTFDSDGVGAEYNEAGNLVTQHSDTATTDYGSATFDYSAFVPTQYDECANLPLLTRGGDCNRFGYVYTHSDGIREWSAARDNGWNLFTATDYIEDGFFNTIIGDTALMSLVFYSTDYYTFDDDNDDDTLDMQYSMQLEVTSVTNGISTVPAPAVIWLIGSGLLGLGYSRKKSA